MSIYYIYSKATGEFMGSGVAPIDNAEVGYTLTPPPSVPVQKPVFDLATKTWKVVQVASVSVVPLSTTV